MPTSIQLSKDTKTKLTKLVAMLQSERADRVTYENAILFLLEKTFSNMENRITLSKNFFGILDPMKALTDLREGRALER